MSRTFRKRSESFFAYYGSRNTIWDKENKVRCKPEHHWEFRFPNKKNPWESYVKDEVLYYSDNYGQGYFRRKFPKYYRNMINRKRRGRDKHELWKEVNLDCYDGLYSSWNCKDSNPSWFW